MSGSGAHYHQQSPRGHQRTQHHPFPQI